MPEGAVYVGRPTVWGNPVKVSRLLGAASAKDVYTFLVWPDADQEEELGNRQKFFLRVARASWKPVTFEQIVSELRGKDLACFCALDQPCHAGFLLDIAND